MVDTPVSPLGAALIGLTKGTVSSQDLGLQQPDTSFLDMDKYGSTLPGQLRGKDFQGAKKAVADNVSRAKAMAVATPEEQEVLSRAYAKQTNLADDEVLRDLMEMDSGSLAYKYGSEVASKANLLRQTYNRVQADLNKPASAPKTDFLVDVADSAVQGIGALGLAGAMQIERIPMALGARPFFSESVGNLMSLASDAAEGLRSTDRQNANRYNAIDDALAAADRQSEYEAKIAKGQDDFSATMENWGQATKDTFDAIVESPTRQRALLGSAIGSMLPIGGLAGAIGKAGAARLALKEGLEIGAATGAKKAAAKNVSEKAATLLIGGMEGGSAAMQAQQEVLGTSLEDLKTNGEFDALVKKGYSPEEARSILARGAADVAFAIAAPIGAITGKLVAPIEARPFSLGSLSKVPGAGIMRLGGNVTKEVAEEGIQGVGGQVASNAGLQSQGFDVRLDEGAPEAGVTGMAGAAFATAALQGGQTALRTGVDAAVLGAKGTLAVGKAAASVAVKAVDKRVEAAAAARDAKNPTGAAARSSSIQTFLQSVGEATTAIKSAIPNTPAAASTTETGSTTPADAASMTEGKMTALNRINDAAFANDQETAQLAAGYEELKTALEAMPADTRALSRPQVIEAAGKRVLDTTVPTQARIFAALDVITNLEKLRQGSSEETLGHLGDAADELTSSTKKLVGKIGQNAKIWEGSAPVKAAQSLLQQADAQEISGILGQVSGFLSSDNATDGDRLSGGQMIEALARLRSDVVPSSVIKTALNQVAKIAPKSSVAKSLAAAQDFNKIGEDADKAKQDLWKTSADDKVRTIDTVRQEIHTDGNGEHLKSLEAYRTQLAEAVNSGDLNTANAVLAGLGRFAKSMGNKVNALNQSYENGGGKMSYKAFGLYSDKPYQSKKLVEMRQDRPSTLNFGRQVWIDANAVSEAYNSLASHYGEALGLTPEEMKHSVPVLMGKPELVPTEGSRRTSNAPSPDAKSEAGMSSILKARAAAQAKAKAEAVADAKAAEDAEAKAKAEEEAKTKAEAEAKAKAEAEAKAKAEEKVTASKPTSQPNLKKLAKFYDMADRLRYAAEISIKDRESGQNEYSQKDLAELDRYLVSLNKEDILALARQSGAKLSAVSDIVNEAFASEEKDFPFNDYNDFVQSAETDSNQPDLFTDNKNAQSVISTTTAQVTPVKTPTTSTQTKAKSATARWFDMAKSLFMVPAGRVNRFLEAFKPSTTNTSSFLEHESAAEFILGRLDGLVTGENDMDRELTNSQSRAMRFFLQERLPRWMETFQNAFAESAFSENGEHKTTWFDALTAGPNFGALAGDPGSYLNGLPSNFIMRDKDGNVVTEERTITVEVVDGQEQRKAKSGRPMVDKDGKPLMKARYKKVQKTVEAPILNHEVLQATFMAAMQWAFSASAPDSRKWDDEAIGKLVGNHRSQAPTDSARAMVKAEGELLQPVLDQISRATQQLLGLSTDPNVSETFTQGIFKAMAANAIRSMEAAGDLVVVNHEIQVRDELGEESPRTFIKIALPPNTGSTKTVKAQVRREAEAFKTRSEVFSEIFLPEVDKAFYIGRPPRKVRQTQLGNKFTRISEKQNSVIERLQQVVFRLNEALFDAVDSVGEDFLGRLMGVIEIPDEEISKWNANDLTAVQSRSLAIKNGFAGARAYREGVDAVVADNVGRNAEDEKAGKKGKRSQVANQIGIFFDYAFSSVGRLQQQGPVNPQNNKQVRELITATKAVLNLKDATQLDNLYLAMAQNLGVKVDRMFKEKSIAKVKDLLNGALAPAVGVLVKSMEAGRKLTSEEQEIFEQSLMAADKAPGSVSMKDFHALTTAAQLRIAMKKGDAALGEFETALSFEADGVTDGPINAMVHMFTGAINQEYLDHLRRGGWFFSNDPFTMQEQREGGAKDLYEMAVDKFQTTLSQDLANKNMSPANAAYRMAMLRVASALLVMPGSSSPDFQILNMDTAQRPNELKFAAQRNLLKNPLTVILYGSSDGGLGAKFADSIQKELYKVFSEIAASGKTWNQHPLFKANPQLAADLDIMMSAEFHPLKAVVTKLPNRAPGQFGQTLSNMLKNPQQATFRSAENTAMVKGLTKFFAKPMSSAIDDVTQGLATNMKMTQKASQIQGLIFQRRFESAIEARLEYLRQPQEKLKPGETSLKKTQLLPAKEIEGVFRELMKAAPIYDTSDMEFHLSGDEAYDSGRVVSQDLVGTLQGNSTSLEPSDVSVRISPYMTIGTGDGQMVLNIYADGKVVLDGSLPVFDGIEIPINAMQTASAEINASVFKGWMGANIYRSILDSFRQTMANTDDATKERLSAQLFEVMGEFADPGSETIDQALKRMEQYLLNAADRVDARKAAMAAFNSSIDHMAGAGAPHQNVGREVTGSIVADMNAVARAEMEKMRKDREPVATKRADKLFTKALQTAGVKVGIKGIKGVKQVVGSKIADLVTRDHGANAQQVKLAETLLKNPFLKGVRIYVGKTAELNKFAAEVLGVENPDMSTGQAYIWEDTVLVSEESDNLLETVLHETTHMVTARAITATTLSPESVPTIIKEAVQRIQALKGQFLGLDLDTSKMSEKQLSALETIQQELTRDDYDEAGKLSEFVAWTLTNQDLMEMAEGQKIHQNPLARIGNAVLKLLRAVLGIQSDPGNTMLSNLRFNAEILGTYQPSIERVEGTEALNRGLDRVAPNRNERLKGIEEQYITRMQRFDAARSKAAGGLAGKNAKFIGDAVAEMDRADRAASEMSYGGFSLDPRETSAFKAVYAVLSSNMKIDPAITRRMIELHAHAVSALTPEAFLKAQGIDPAKASAKQKTKARRMVATVGSSLSSRKTAAGQTDALATFFSLAQVHPELREILTTMPAPKTLEIEVNNLDDAVTSMANSATNALVNLSLTAGRQPTSVQAQLDLLSEKISQVNANRSVTEALSFVENFSPLEWANKQGSSILKNGTDKVLGYAADGRKRSTTKVGKTAFGALEIATSLMNADGFKGTSNWLTTMMNQSDGWHSIRALVRDVIGSQPDTKDLFRLLNKSKGQVDKVRQGFRDQTPADLADMFSRKLSREEWADLHQGIGQVDLLAFDQKTALRVLSDPKSIASDIASFKQEIEGRVGKSRAADIVARSEALATYMHDRSVVSNMLARNATAIAGNFGGKGWGTPNPEEGLVQAVDRMVTMMAFDKLGVGTKERLSALTKTEDQGLRAVTGFMAKIRDMEMERLRKAAGVSDSSIAVHNGLKGYIPAHVTEGHEILVLPDADADEFQQRGYERIGDYKGITKKRHGYYRTTLSGRNAYKQGTALKVLQSWNGVDPRTGLMRGPETFGFVKGVEASALTKTLDIVGIDHATVPSEHMLPLYDQEGQVYAYEHSVHPKHLETLPRDNHMGRMLGSWAGRIVEEGMADEINLALLDFLENTWDEGKGTRSNEFVNIADPKNQDPVIRDMWASMGWRFKHQAEKTFGKNKLMVRKDMLDDAFGYRQAGVTDVWTGVSRLSPEIQKVTRDMLVGIMGNKAFQWSKRTEVFVQGAVGLAKENIIVRSVVTTVKNFKSNVAQLAIQGVNPIKAATGMRRKFIELTTHLKNEEELRRLDVKLAALDQNSTAADALRNRMRVLKDASKSLSIYPLLAAYEFSTISEDLTEDDVAIREGKWGERLEALVNKLPRGANGLIRNGFAMKGSGLHRLLSRMSQYGDFLAKAVLFDHLSEGGMSEQGAIDFVSEEFVNYNRLPGRGRDYLESSTGLLWFFNYKLRSMHIALRTLRDKPLTSLLMMGANQMGAGITTPLDGTLVGRYMSGDLGYSIGVEQGLDGLMITPWDAIFR